MPKLFLAGHRGLVGSAVFRHLQKEAPRYEVLTRSRQELNLFDPESVDAFFREHRPEYVIDAAAKVGGIKANSTYPVDFLLENLQIQNNLMQAAHRYDVEKFVFLGSSCIYPRMCPQPMKEEHLLTGALEPTNEPYAIAKIAGIRLGQAYRRQYGRNFISIMPTNLYGPNDNFDLETSHVPAAMLRKFHEAKEGLTDRVTLWGTGSARREFLHVDDMAAATVFLMETYNEEQIVNVGCGEEISIREFADLVQSVVGYEGPVDWDSSRPDGTPLKRLDVSRISSLGWKPAIPLREGLASTYEWYLQQG